MATPPVSLRRKDATFTQSQLTGAAHVRLVSCIEFLSPGRVPSLGVKTDLLLRPNVIYKAFTGVCFQGAPPFAALQVQADNASWKYGVEVKRLEYGVENELVIYFTILEPVALANISPSLGFDLLGIKGNVGNFMFNENSGELPLPGIKIAVEPKTAKRYIEKSQTAPQSQKAAADSEAEAARKAAAYWNTPDTVGRVVDGPAALTPPPVDNIPTEFPPTTLPLAGLPRVQWSEQTTVQLPINGERAVTVDPASIENM